MPSTIIGIARTAIRCQGSQRLSSAKMPQPARVPKVPGAQRARPLPNPRAMKCAGCETRKRASGALEVVVSAAIDLHRLAVPVQQAHALAALHLADAGDRDA